MPTVPSCPTCCTPSSSSATLCNNERRPERGNDRAHGLSRLRDVLRRLRARHREPARCHGGGRNLVDAIEELGYGVPQPVAGEDVEEQARAHEYAALQRRLWLAAAFAIPVVVLGMWPGLMDLAAMSWIQLALTVPVIFYAGAPFYKGAWTALRHRSANMNTLIAER